MEDFKTIGEILRLKREEKNYSISEVAKLTNIPEKHIVALESNDFEKLPARVHVTGFIRLYANFLGLEESYILEVLDRQLKMEEKPPIEELASIVKEDFNGSLRKNYFIIGFGLLILVIVGIIFILQDRSSVSSNYSYEQKANIVEDKNNIVLKKGEVSSIKIKNNIVKIKLNEISENIISINFIDYNRNIILKNNEYLSFDVDNDEVFDAGIYIKDIKDNEVELNIDEIQEKRLVKDVFSIGIKKETSVVSVGVKLKIVNKTKNKIYLFIKTQTDDIEKELVDQIELDLISGSDLGINSIGFSDISAVDIFVNDDKLIFNTQAGSVGYIKFNFDNSTGNKKLTWEITS